MDELMVVGGGLSGLVAAISAAESGQRVRLLEAASSFGGRARTLRAPYRANLGPHAVYVDGVLWKWLVARNLEPEVVPAPPYSSLYCTGGRLHHYITGLNAAFEQLPSVAPSGAGYRNWLVGHIEPSLAEVIVGLLFITVYDHDPGRLSAATMHEFLSRSLANPVRYVIGGWSRLIEGLVERCVELGVELRLNTRVRELQNCATILATRLDDARQLTGDPTLSWPGTQPLLLDVALRADRKIEWFRLFDVDARIYAARYSRVDSSLAPNGEDLIQMAIAYAPGEDIGAPLDRAGRLLDLAWPGWRDRVRWSRKSVVRGRTGAIALPGTTWRDRPTVMRNRHLFVTTDQSAAPGLLAEVGVAAALEATMLITGKVPEAAGPKFPGTSEGGS